MISIREGLHDMLHDPRCRDDRFDVTRMKSRSFAIAVLTLGLPCLSARQCPSQTIASWRFIVSVCRKRACGPESLRTAFPIDNLERTYLQTKASCQNIALHERGQLTWPASISTTLATRRAYFSSLTPSHSVLIQTRTISASRADPTILAPRQSALVLECDWASAAQKGSWATAANTRGTLLAVIALP